MHKCPTIPFAEQSEVGRQRSVSLEKFVSSGLEQEAVFVLAGREHQLLLVVQTLGIVDFLRDFDGETLALHMDL